MTRNMKTVLVCMFVTLCAVAVFWTLWTSFIGPIPVQKTLVWQTETSSWYLPPVHRAWDLVCLPLIFGMLGTFHVFKRTELDTKEAIEMGYLVIVGLYSAVVVMTLCALLFSSFLLALCIGLMVFVLCGFLKVTEGGTIQNSIFASATVGVLYGGFAGLFLLGILFVVHAVVLSAYFLVSGIVFLLFLKEESS